MNGLTNDIYQPQAVLIDERFDVRQRLGQLLTASEAMVANFCLPLRIVLSDFLAGGDGCVCNRSQRH